MEQRDDAQLVLAARGGDRAALGALVAHWHPGVLQLCRRLLGPGPEAEDVAQDAILAACLSLERLREPARFGPWMLAIAANLARMTLRRRRLLSLEALDEPPGLVTLWSAATPDPAEVAALRELHDAIVAALAELSPLSREAVIGFYLEGYSYAELAALLNVPVGTLKGRLVFGRRQLRRRLNTWLPDGHTHKQKEVPVEQPALIPVLIDSVRVSLKTRHRSVVLREQEGERLLPIFIGPAEADAIAQGLAGQQLPRPMTHDLSLRLLEPLGATVREVVVTRITDQTFFADVVVQHGAASYHVDARPSDALALAVRAGAPILVARAVLDEAANSALLADTEPLELGTPPPPETTAVFVGLQEAEQQAIVGAVLGSSVGLLGMHLGPSTEAVLAAVGEAGQRFVVVDLDESPAERLALVTALRLQDAAVPILELGGAAETALAAGASVHLPRPLDVEALRQAVWDAAVAVHRASR